MVPLLNAPFLEHVLRRLYAFDVREVVLALSHLAPAIESYFGNGSKLGMDLKYVIETTPLGTAGAARNALGYIQEACLVMNGDIFTGLNLAALKESHDSHQAQVTIALTRVPNPSAYGLVETEANGRVHRFLEKPSPLEITTDFINAGSYVISPSVLADIRSDTVISFERDVFPALLACRAPVFSFADDSYWIDIGTPAKYQQLNRDLLSGRASPTQRFSAGSTRTVISPSACLEGNVLIGDNCYIGENVTISGPTVIGDGCYLEAGAIVSDAIIWHNVSIGAGCNIETSVIGDNCNLGSSCRLSDCVVGDHVAISRDYYQTGGQIWPSLI
jgi:mannose-1-phosphate guanylyltransferase